MKIWKGCFSFVIALVIIGFLCSTSSAQSLPPLQTSHADLHAFDLLVVRPVSAVAAVVGTAVAIATLPFTIPTNSVEESVRLFVHEPFKFAFEREFPDYQYVDLYTKR